MNKQFIIVAILLLITLSPQCTAMNEVATPAKIIKKINTSKKFDSIIGLSDTLIVLKGREHCSLFDISINKEVQQLENENKLEHDIHITTNPDKTLLAVRDNDHISIYDIATHNKIWEHNAPYACSAPIFNPITKQLLVRDRIDSKLNQFDYTNTLPQPTKKMPFDTMSARERIELIDIFDDLNPVPQAIKMPEDHGIVFNPTKKAYITYPLMGFAKQTIIRQYDIEQTTRTNYPSKKPILICKYSPDGSILALQHTYSECSIFDLKTQKQTFFNANIDSTFTIAFNQKNLILATLVLTKPNLTHEIYYWNAKTQQLIASTALKTIYSNVTTYDFCQRIDFSADGTQMIAVLDNECLVLEVPFEAQYQPDTKEKCAFALWMLKNYKNENGDNVLPEELANFLTYNLLQTCKYSFTNY